MILPRIFLACSLLPLLACRQQRFESLPMNPNVKFLERIARIAEQAGDLSTTPDVLFHDRAFIEIYEGPSAFVSAAAAIYADPKQPILFKEITGYAMQRLPLEEYGSLVSLVADMVSKNALPPRLLDKLAFPAFNWGAQLAVNFENPKVQALLETMTGLPQLSQQRREMIRTSVLTGATRKDFLTLQEAGQVR